MTEAPDEDQWVPTGQVYPFVGEVVRYVKRRGQIGFRRLVLNREGKPSQVVYTWEQHGVQAP